MNATTFAERLDFALKKTGKSAYKLSKGINLQQSTISNYKSGKTIPNSITIKAIASYLEVDANWLEFSTGDFKYLKSDADVGSLTVSDHIEPYPNKNGNVFEELKSGKIKIYTKKVPVRAFASYLSDFQNVNFYDDLEEVSFTVTHFARGRYLCFESEGDSMNGGGINDTPSEADLLCRELQRHHWKDGFRQSEYGWVIVHRDTVVFKDIKNFDIENGDITCSSRSGLPQHPDFKINLDDCKEIWKVIKRSF